ncbi:dynein light chain Tctex-type 1-like [Pristis pectinata]|uniref:dynein light chain Tctex-type 1-like n=1 Tax=Pristis pectinata TaxID=685728 RepID=UPI00223DB76E|nr:dynein light chain Tctex-type 1-like [Pristis pectinata]
MVQWPRACPKEATARRDVFTRVSGHSPASILSDPFCCDNGTRTGAVMDDFQQAEEAAFVVDDVSTIIKEAVENTIGGNAYQHNKVNQWTASVVEQCLNQLTKLAKPFKYIVTCVIMQKNGAGLHTASSCFWDNSIDGSCTVRWENKTMYCIVSIFGLGV